MQEVVTRGESVLIRWLNFSRKASSRKGGFKVEFTGGFRVVRKRGGGCQSGKMMTKLLNSICFVFNMSA